MRNVVTRAAVISPSSASSDGASSKRRVRLPSSASPAALGRMPRPTFSNSATPNRASMRRICCDTAEAVLCSRRAASPTEPVWATTSAS